MERMKSSEWFDKLQERANQSKEFQKAAKWFDGAIGWKISGEAHTFTVSRGLIRAIEPGLKNPIFAVVGDPEGWNELFAKGTINRLFRQNKLKIEGNRVEAMRYWKILWYLTEIARGIQ